MNGHFLPQYGQVRTLCAMGLQWTDGRTVSISVVCTCSGRGWWCMSMRVPTDVGADWLVAWPAFDDDGSARETIHSSCWCSGLHRVACVAVCVL